MAGVGTVTVSERKSIKFIMPPIRWDEKGYGKEARGERRTGIHGSLGLLPLPFSL